MTANVENRLLFLGIPLFMRHLIIVSAFIALGLLGSANAQEPRFVISYGPVTNQALQPLAQSMRDAKYLEVMADAISRMIRLPQNVTLGVGQCNQINAFYNSRQKAIVICLELLNQIVTTVPRQFQRIATPAEIGKIANGALFLFCSTKWVML